MTHTPSQPRARELRRSQIAIVGHGAAALATLVTFRAEGLPAGAVTIYGDQPDPLHNFRRYTSAIRQERMRSESNGHFFPSDWPGLALFDSLRSFSPMPLLRSLFDRYQPELADLLAHSDTVAREVGLTQSLVHARVGRIARDPRSWYPGFVLFDEAGQALGVARHVILALGQPALRWPEPLLALNAGPRVRHAFQPKEYRTGETVAVVGGGMAAAHEWLAALHAGCHVIAIGRRPARLQPLNAPRCDFSAVGIGRYQRLEPAERHAYLDQLGIGSYPQRPAWEREFALARRQHRWRRVEASVISAGVGEDSVSLGLTNGERISVQQVVCATGFNSDVAEHALIGQLARDYGARVERGRLMVNDDFTLALRGHRQARLAVVGTLARWALPTADTFAGMKYVARRLLPVLGIPPNAPRRILFSLQLGLRAW